MPGVTWSDVSRQRYARPPGQRSNEDSAQDLAQSIWAELLVCAFATIESRPANSYYSGRGSLAGWLRAVVDTAIDQHRKQSRTVQTEDDADFDRLTRGGDDGKELYSGHRARLIQRKQISIG